MALSRWERKAKLGHRGATRVKEETGYALSYVSQVVSGKRRNRRIEVVSARIMGVPVDKAYRPRKTRKMHNGQSRLKRD